MAEIITYRSAKAASCGQWSDDCEGRIDENATTVLVASKLIAKGSAWDIEPGGKPAVDSSGALVAVIILPFQ
jgi:hypothetical protein